MCLAVDDNPTSLVVVATAAMKLFDIGDNVRAADDITISFVVNSIAATQLVGLSPQPP